MRMIQVAKSGEASLKVGKKSKNLKNPQIGKIALKGSKENPKGKVVTSFKNTLALNLKNVEKKSTPKESLVKSSLTMAKTERKEDVAKLVSKKEKSAKKIKKGEGLESTVAQIVPGENPKDPKVEVVSKGDTPRETPKVEAKESGRVKDNIISQLNLDKNIKEPKKLGKRTKLDEVNNKTESKNEKKRVSVNDLRTNNQKETPQGVTPEGVKVTQDPTIQNSEIESSTEKTIVLGTTEVSAEGEGGKAQAPVMKEAATQLKQQLKDFGNNEIVKNTRFILKDNNVGEIKLILKPESLGEVKINLNLNDNNLAGKIVVENAAVKEVFQENMNSLTKALESKGFDSANLDLSLSDKGEGRGHREQGENKQYFSERLKKFEESGRVVRYGLPTAGINITA